MKSGMPISTKLNLQEDSRICKIYLESSEPHDEPPERHPNGGSALKKSFSSSVTTMLSRRHSWSKKDSIELLDSTRKIRLDLNTEFAIDIKKTMSQGIICTKSVCYECNHSIWSWFVYCIYVFAAVGYPVQAAQLQGRFQEAAQR